MHLPNASVAVEQKHAWQVLSGIRRAPRRAVPKSWWVGLTALLVSVLALYVHTVGEEAKLNHTQRELQLLKQETVLLRSQLASLQNPSNVEKKATQALNMEAPREVVYMQEPAQVAAPQVNRIPPPPAVIHEGF